MDSRLSQLFYCMVLAYAGTYIGMFLYDVIEQILKIFPDRSPKTFFLLLLSFSSYFSWVFGASTSGFEKLSHAIRGTLSTIFLNIGMVWSVKERFNLEEITLDTIPPIVIFIMVMNTLIAMFASNAVEEYAHLKDKKVQSNPMMLTYVTCFPLPIIGTFWVLKIIIEKVFTLI